MTKVRVHKKLTQRIRITPKTKKVEISKENYKNYLQFLKNSREQAEAELWFEAIFDEQTSALLQSHLTL